MNYKEYLEKGPEEGNSELIELLAEMIRGEVLPTFEEKADKQLNEAEDRLKYVTTKYIDSLKLRTHELNEQLLQAEKSWHEERRELAKINIEYRSKVNMLDAERRKTIAAKKFYYVAGGIWFLAFAAYIIKLWL